YSLEIGGAERRISRWECFSYKATDCIRGLLDRESIMGQKIRPTGFRTGIFVPWLSNWYAGKQEFAELLLEDRKIRMFIKRKYGGAGISKIRIERTREKVVVYIFSARVGVIIGKKGAEIDKLTKSLEDLCHRHIELK